MPRFLKALTLVLAFLSAVSGVLLSIFLSSIERQLHNVVEVRWVLILGMPILLTLTFVRLNLTPAKNLFGVVMQSVALLAIFIAPYWWVVRNVQ
jgi:hypothetical protein